MTEEGRELVARYTEPAEREAASQLAALLAESPIALALTAACLRESKEDPREHLRAWLSLEEQTLRGGGFRPDYQVLLSATLSLRRLSAEGEPAVFLLLLLSFFAAEDIPRAVLDTWTLPPDAPRIDILTDPAVIRSSLETLRRHRLLVIREESLAFPHPLVQAAAQRQVARHEREKITSLLVYRMLELFEFEPRDESQWPRLAALIPHISAVLDHHKELDGHSEGEASLTMQVGAYFLVRENLPRAKEFFLRTASRAGELSEPVCRSYVSLLSHLAEMFERCDLPSEADELLRGAQRLAERGLPSDDAERGVLLRKRGGIARQKGEVSTARAFYEQALALDQRARALSLETAHDAYYLALVDIDENNRESAGRWLERASGIYETLSPEPAPPEWISATGLAAGYFAERGELHRAKTYYERAIPLLSRSQGPTYFVLAVLWAGLAAVLDDLGDTEEARDACERALLIYEENEDHDTELSRALLMNRLGLLLEELGDSDEARDRLEAALDILCRRLGDEHPDTQTVRGNLEQLCARLSSKEA